MLQNAGGDELEVVSTSKFTMPTPVMDGAAYEITVAANPVWPAQSCEVSAGSGVIAAADVDDVVITCTTLAPAGLDPEFGEDGVVILTEFGSFDAGAANELELLPDDRILLAAQVEAGFGHDGGLLRLEADGSLDASFGDGGVASFDNSQMETFTGVAADGDAAIAVGWGRPMGGKTDVLVARYDEVGVEDPGFGELGLARFDNLLGGCQDMLSNDTALTVAMDADGFLLVVGFAQETDCSDSDGFVLRVDAATGELDPTFGVNGVFSHQVVGDPQTDVRVDQMAAMALRDDSIILTGTTWTEQSANDASAVLWALDSQGALDPAVGGAGYVVLENVGEGTFGRGVGVDVNGALYISGSTGTDTTSLFLARLMPDGALADEFGDGGVVTMGGGTDVASGEGVVVDESGRVVVGGYRDNLAGDTDIAIWRFLPSGELDASFGHEGILVVDSGFGRDLGLTIGIDSENRIVVAGSAMTPTEEPAIALIRALP